MDQQQGLCEYINRSNQISHHHQSIMSYNSQVYCYPKLSLFEKKYDENQPQLDSCPLSQGKNEKNDEPTQDKDLNELKPADNEFNYAKSMRFSSQKLDSYKRCFQGTRNDTMQLNINFKTLLLSHFRQLIYLNQLTPSEIASVDQFASTSPSFRSLKAFYQQREGNQGIRAKCFDFLSNKSCITKILSGRCKLRNKLMMIKFIEKMRRNLTNKDQITKWKDSHKWELTTHA